MYLFQDGIGNGSPYEGSDISVYHIETDFLLGAVANISGEPQTSQPWIWPVCHPKNDNDPEFQSKKGMVAGWLDAPPVDQTFTNIFGAGVKEADVFRYDD